MPVGDLSEGVSHLSDAIVACGVMPLLAKIGNQSWQDRPTPSALLACYACFSMDEVNFGVAERLIIKELGINRVADVEWWARVVVAVADQEPYEPMLLEVAELYQKLRFVADTLPNLVAGTATDLKRSGMDLIQVRLPVQTNGPVHPMRLSCAIDAVCTLWNVACDVEGGRVPLALVMCDPQTEITVTFRGPVLQIATLKGIMMQVWDSVVTSLGCSLDEWIAAIPSSLPVAQQIKAGAQGAITTLRDLETGVRLFLESGAFIPEMDNPSRYTPARVLQVNAALLQGTAPCWPDRLNPFEAEQLAGDGATTTPTRQPVWIGRLRAIEARTAGT